MDVVDSSSSSPYAHLVERYKATKQHSEKLKISDELWQRANLDNPDLKRWLDLVDQRASSDGRLARWHDRRRRAEDVAVDREATGEQAHGVVARARRSGRARAAAASSLKAACAARSRPTSWASRRATRSSSARSASSMSSPGSAR